MLGSLHEKINGFINKRRIYDFRIKASIFNVYCIPPGFPPLLGLCSEGVVIKYYKEPETVIEEIKNKICDDTITFKNYLGDDFDGWIINEPPVDGTAYKIKIKMDYSNFSRIVNLMNSYFPHIDFHDIVLGDLVNRFSDYHLIVLDSELAMTLLKYYFENMVGDKIYLHNVFRLMKLAQKFGVTKKRFCEHFFVPDLLKNISRFHYFTRTLDRERPCILYSELQNRKVKINIYESDFKKLLFNTI